MRKTRKLSPLFAMFALVLTVAGAGAQDRASGSPMPTLTHVDRLLEALVARTSFNEAGDSYFDLALVWQTTEGHGETARDRYLWLAAHSPCVSGRLTQDQAQARPGNCRWTRNLSSRPSPAPIGWDLRRDGVWRATERRWLEHVPRARAFTRGEDPFRPCRTTPQTWDGVRYGRERVSRGDRVIVEDCTPPYTDNPHAEGLHNFAVIRSRWGA
jgi:hypothetical protein